MKVLFSADQSLTSTPQVGSFYTTAERHETKARYINIDSSFATIQFANPTVNKLHEILHSTRGNLSQRLEKSVRFLPGKSESVHSSVKLHQSEISRHLLAESIHKGQSKYTSVLKGTVDT